MKLSTSMTPCVSFCALIVAAAGSFACAGVSVTTAHVSNTYTYDIGATPSPGDPAPGAAVFDSSNAGNVFTTYDGNTGFTSTISPSTGGYFRVNTRATYAHFLGLSDAYTASTDGSVHFVADSSFSLSHGVPPDEAGGGFHTGQITITNTATSEAFTLACTATSPIVSGNFPAIAPPGDYQIDFSMSSFRETGVGRPGALQINLTMVPEPATLSLIAPVVMLLVRRR